jgi:hypothetical protein
MLAGCGGTSGGGTGVIVPAKLYKGKLLTIRQVTDAFASEGFRLRPLLKGKHVPPAYEAMKLPAHSYVLVGISPSRSQSPPGFTYAVRSTEKPKRVVVKNVAILYHASSGVLRRLTAAIATLRREARN